MSNLLRRAALTGVVCLFSLQLSANTDFRILADLDNSAATGCTVNGMQGVERVITTTLDTTGATPRVTNVVRQDCSGASLGTPITVDNNGWPAVSNPTTGITVVESRIPFVVFGNPFPTTMRLGFVATDGTHTATVFTDADGNPILFPNTPPRRREVGQGTRTFVMDGLTGDWEGLQPIAFADSHSSNLLRLVAVFAFPQSEVAYFRFYAQSHTAAPTASNDTFTTPLHTPLTVPAPGVLGNDTDPNSRPLTAVQLTGPDRGLLVFNSDGSMTYTPDNSGPTR